MKQSPSNCIACGLNGMPQVWNEMNVLVCPACGLGWRTSFDLPASYYAQLHAGEDGPGEEKVWSRMRNAQDRLAEVVRFLPETCICDIGCGDGSFLLVLKQSGYKGCWGIEPSAYARKLASDKQLDVEDGDISERSEASQGRKIKALTLFHVIEHLSDPVVALENIKTMLNSGDILVIETPDADAAIQRVTNHKNALVYPEHLFYWNEKSLRTFLEHNGFRILLICHRSFDWKNAPIRASLARFGLLNKQVSSIPHQNSHNEGEKTEVSHKKSFLRRCVRTFLAYLVHILRLDDYLLVVAERV